MVLSCDPGTPRNSEPVLGRLCADAMLDLAPCRPDQELINATVLKHVLGQAAFQVEASGGLATEAHSGAQGGQLGA